MVTKKSKKTTMSVKYFKDDGPTNPPKQKVSNVYRNKSVKKLALTEFGQYMNTVQGMNSDRVEEQKKDCFNF